MPSTHSLGKALKQLARDSIHGGALKTLALISRLAFFALIIPALPSGELGTYVYINSVALIASVVLIFGLNDELPRLIRGDPHRARAYLPMNRWLILLALLIVAAMLVAPSVWLGTILFSTTLVAGRFFSGIVRSVDPATHERVQNLPWILFIIVAVGLGLDSAFELILARCALILLLVVYGAWLMRTRAVNGTTTAIATLPALAKRAWEHGVWKLLTNVCLLGLMRGPVLLPVWLGLGTDLDTIAFCVAVGEVIVQFALIPINRAYAAWCREIPTQLHDWNQAILFSVLLSAATALVAIVAAQAAYTLGLMPGQAPEVVAFWPAIVFYALMSGSYSVVYLAWARGILRNYMVLLYAGMFASTTAVVVLMPVEFWFLAFSGVAALGFLAMATRSRKEFL